MRRCNAWGGICCPGDAANVKPRNILRRVGIIDGPVAHLLDRRVEADICRPDLRRVKAGRSAIYEAFRGAKEECVRGLVAIRERFRVQVVGWMRFAVRQDHHDGRSYVFKLHQPVCLSSYPDLKFARRFNRWRSNPEYFERRIAPVVMRRHARPLAEASVIAMELQIPVEAVENIIVRAVLQEVVFELSRCTRDKSSRGPKAFLYAVPVLITLLRTRISSLRGKRLKDRTKAWMLVFAKAWILVLDKLLGPKSHTDDRRLPKE